jgi:hypothetical protein
LLASEPLRKYDLHDTTCTVPSHRPFTMSKLDPSGTAPIPVVDMIFSQPILLQKKLRGAPP